MGGAAASFEEAGRKKSLMLARALVNRDQSLRSAPPRVDPPAAGKGTARSRPSRGGIFVTPAATAEQIGAIVAGGVPARPDAASRPTPAWRHSRAPTSKRLLRCCVLYGAGGSRRDDFTVLARRPDDRQRGLLMPDKLRVALSGAGTLVQSRACRFFPLAPCDVVAICELDEDMARDAAARFGHRDRLH